MKVENEEDLNRDVFKSETSRIIIPEIGFESSCGSLGSMYTTVGGVIDKIYNNLNDTPFTSGDSCVNNDIDKFFNKLRNLQNLKSKFTLIIDYPIANSFIFPIGEPDNDKKLTKEKYDRTFEQKEEFGINHMKVDNY